MKSLSIDIADVDVGRNVGAQLQIDQAEADKRIAQAKAEERRAMAVAKEQEMLAATQEMRAKVVEAGSTRPHRSCRSLEIRKYGRYGLLQYEESDSRHRYAQFHIGQFGKPGK